MSSIRISTHVAAPVDTTFDCFSDFTNAAEHVDGIVRVEWLTDGPVGVGSRFRETRIMFKKEATETMEIMSFDRPHGYALGCDSCGCRYQTDFRFSPRGNGTDVEVEMRAVPVTFMAKLLSPIGRLFNGMMKKCVQQDIEQIKTRAESAQADASS